MRITLAKRVGQELGIPVYTYEAAATRPERKNLATIRAGEYEGFAKKMEQADWKPDYGPAAFNEKAGATVIGARDFLIAYNVNLNTRSERKANSVAFDIREKGRIKRKGNPVTGEIIRDENGEPVREEGMCKGVKAIGWYIAEYGTAQVSMNITDTKLTALHTAFDACVHECITPGDARDGFGVGRPGAFGSDAGCGEVFFEKAEIVSRRVRCGAHSYRRQEYGAG